MEANFFIQQYNGQHTHNCYFSGIHSIHWLHDRLETIAATGTLKTVAIFRIKFKEPLHSVLQDEPTYEDELSSYEKEKQDRKFYHNAMAD